MAEVFNGIIEGGYWVAFGSLSPKQQRCKDVTAEMIDDIFSVRQRERFVHEVKTCVCGYPVADENEPMAPEHFSQFQFYLPIERELVSFVDRFDYLICCIANGICKVHVGFEERYERALLNVVTFRIAIVPAAPHRVLDERLVADLRRADLVDIGLNNRSPARQEQAISTYLAKADPFSKAVRDELAQLEAEEAAAEHRRREEADRAAGHNPYRVDEGEANTVADEMTDADIAAVYEEARHGSSIMTHKGIIVEMVKGPTATADQQQRNSVSRRIELEEDPTPTLTLVLTVKAEEEARKELERRRYERRDRLLEEKKREEREKAEKADAEEKDRVQAAEAEIARLEKERVELEIRAAAAQRELAEATKIRDAERAKMELQFQQYASAEEAKQLEEANAREERARAEAEKAARRRQEAAEREAIAREAAARETRRLELITSREAIMREEAALKIVEERMAAARGQ